MIVTEYTFLQDMIALEESYNAFTGECPTITARHKQTIFGKVKNVLSFTDKFHKELVQAADSFLKRTEDSIMNCTYEELVKWDSDVSVGETFWSSVIQTRDVVDVDGEDRKSVYRILYTSGRGLADNAGT